MTDKEYLVEKLLSGTEAWNQWRLENPNQARLDLRQVNLSGANLREADLSKADLTGANLSGVNLTQAKLYAASLTGTNLSHASLAGAILNGAILIEADLSGANLFYANLRSVPPPINNPRHKFFGKQYHFIIKAIHRYGSPRTNLMNANLQNTNLRSAELQGVILKKANLRKSILYRANLLCADLSEAELPFADLREANLRRANLVCTNLDKAWTSDAKLEGATYSEATILPPLNQMQQQSMILVNPPLELDNKEVLVDLESIKDERKRTNVERVIRKNQGKFRNLLLDVFQGKCAITTCNVERALDAAHILPYRGQATDCAWNGILLRLDLHRLFDSYLLTIDALSGQVYLEPSLMNSYAVIANTKVYFPEKPVSENRKQALRWHNAQCSWLRSE
jgi:uncharacterized protein YjbI with pentapeptide repeats